MAISRPSIDSLEKYLSLASLFFPTSLFLILWHHFPPTLEFLNTIKPLNFVSTPLPSALTFQL
jgi:hypothetical protein